MVKKIFFVKKIFGQKIFIEKIFWSNNPGKIKILVKIVFVHKYRSVKKIFWLINMFWLKKILGKNNSVKTIFQ